MNYIKLLSFIVVSQINPKKIFCFFILTLLTFSLSQFSQAGVMEFGVSGTFRRSTIDKENYQESTSYSGSISYYFWELSALELSYTKGISILSVKPAADEPKVITRSLFQLFGVDLVITLGSRQSLLQPYIKIGGAKIQKKIVREPEGLSSTEIESPPGVVPSAGLGLKIQLSQTFSIKTGLDAWTSPIGEENQTIDYAARAGVSWLF